MAVICVDVVPLWVMANRGRVNFCPLCISILTVFLLFTSLQRHNSYGLDVISFLFYGN